MVRGLVVLLISISASVAWATGDDEVPLKPNPELTSGDYCTPQDKDFIGYRYEEKIPFCQRNVSRELKAQIYEDYDVDPNCRFNYTVDHFIPLSMGGSNQPENLWPEHKEIKATRQNLEQDVYTRLARGEISQKQAVMAIVRAKMNPPHVRPQPCR